MGRLALRATMALAALALALAAPAARRLEVDYEGYKKLAMEGNAEALQQKFKHASPEEQLAIKNEIVENIFVETFEVSSVDVKSDQEYDLAAAVSDWVAKLHSARTDANYDGEHWDRAVCRTAMLASGE